MGDERKTMQQYLDALTARADYGQYFTDDVVVTVEGSDQRAEGPGGRRATHPVHA